MHLDPDDLARNAPYQIDPAVVFDARPDAPTETWPRQRAVERQEGDNRTRLALEALRDVAEPTTALPVVSEVPIAAPEAVRTTPAPPVKPIPKAARDRAAHPSAGHRAPVSPEAAETIARVLAAGPTPLEARIRRFGPGGWFGWRPLGGPTVHEIAEARRKVAEAEERRRFRHARHLDVLEILRAWLKVAILFGLLVLVVGAGVVAFLILSGHWAWMPSKAD